jgi:hypothetical protein
MARSMFCFRTTTRMLHNQNNVTASCEFLTTILIQTYYVPYISHCYNSITMLPVLHVMGCWLGSACRLCLTAWTNMVSGLDIVYRCAMIREWASNILISLTTEPHPTSCWSECRTCLPFDTDALKNGSWANLKATANVQLYASPNSRITFLTND